MEVSGELHAPAALPPEKDPPCTHWIGGLSGHQSRSGRCEEKKNHVFVIKKANWFLFK
jgi:hypothetical protein